MKTKLQSLLFPVINIVIPVGFICVQTFGSNKTFADLLFMFSFTLLFGVILGGILPILMIAIYRIDVSRYFRTSCIAFLISAGICCLSWFETSGITVILAPIILECVTVLYFAKKHLREELCASQGKRKLAVFALANPILLYLGFVLDFIIGFLNSGQGFNIPG